MSQLLSRSGLLIYSSRNLVPLSRLQSSDPPPPPTTEITDENGKPAVRERKEETLEKQADEERGVFRVLDLGNKKSSSSSDAMGGRRRKKFKYLDRKIPSTDEAAKIEWTDIWPAPKTFHPFVVPLPIRQGYPASYNNNVVPDKFANAELMKIPNFLHATPPAIKQHCAAIKKFCTPWPENFDSEEVMRAHFPVVKTSSDYLNASSSIRDFRARILTFSFKLSDLCLNPEAKDKLCRLLGDRYDEDSDVVTMTVDRCPYRKQNEDYWKYLLTACIYESVKVEEWEAKREFMDAIEFEYDQQVPGLQDKKVNPVLKDEVKEAMNKLINEGENLNTLAMYKEKAVAAIFDKKF